MQVRIGHTDFFRASPIWTRRGGTTDKSFSFVALFQSIGSNFFI